MFQRSYKDPRALPRINGEPAMVLEVIKAFRAQYHRETKYSVCAHCVAAAERLADELDNP